jgi:hypothetical protein
MDILLVVLKVDVVLKTSIVILKIQHSRKIKTSTSNVTEKKMKKIKLELYGQLTDSHSTLNLIPSLVMAQTALT